MRAAIKGAIPGDRGIIKMLSEKSSVKIIHIMDNDILKVGTEIAGVEVISPLQCRDEYRHGKLDCVILPGSLGINTLFSMVRELEAMGFNRKDIYVASPSLETQRCYMEIVRYDDWNSLDYLEFHVAHVCNLNCKGCCHFSSITYQKFPIYDTWNEGITRLKLSFPFIKWIVLLGGEPLLNQELNKYLDRTRALYPDSKITVLSNAIFAAKINKKIINSLHENNINIDVTIYPSTYDGMEKNIAFLRENDCLGNVHFSTEFTKMLSRRKVKFPYKTTEGICHCPNLVGTKLYACPIIAYISDFNKKFNFAFPSGDNGVDLLDETLDAKKIKKDLYSPFKLCDYCRAYLTDRFRASNEDSMAWENYKPGDTPSANDWLLD